MKKIAIVLIMLLFVLGACSLFQQKNETGNYSIIPSPVNLEKSPGFYELSTNSLVWVTESAEAENVVDYFISHIFQTTGLKIRKTDEPDKRGVISFNLDENKSFGNEGYELNVEKNRIDIKANTSSGLFYGVQSLLQLLPPEIFSAEPIKNVEWKVPCCKIEDYPRFKWRGMHLDVSRHFFNVDFIKRYIDLIAMHKMNVFHWHLTDDNKKIPGINQSVCLEG